MKYQKIKIDHPGGPENLKLVEEEIPEVLGNHVLVKIQAAGIAYADVLMREGIYPNMPKFPITPGYDIVGTIEQIGEKVTMLKKGQRVAALTGTGGYAEYILLPENELVPVPNDLDAAEAVALVLNYVTAYQMLHRAASLQTGDSILIHGAAGGVGTAFLQLGKLMGLKIYGTASSRKHSLIESLGGIPIDYKNDDVEKKMRSLVPNGLAAVFDGTGEWLYPSYRLLKPNGLLIVYGASSMLDKGRKSLLKTMFTYLRFSIFLKNLLPGKKKIVFYTITKYKKEHPEWFRQDLVELFNLLKQGKIKPVIAMKKALAETAECHELLNDAAVSGKMVIMPI